MNDAANYSHEEENKVVEGNADGRRAVEVDWDGAMMGSGRWTRKPMAASSGTSLDYGHVIPNFCTFLSSPS